MYNVCDCYSKYRLLSTDEAWRRRGMADHAFQPLMRRTQTSNPTQSTSAYKFRRRQTRCYTACYIHTPTKYTNQTKFTFYLVIFFKKSISWKSWNASVHKQIFVQQVRFLSFWRASGISGGASASIEGKESLRPSSKVKSLQQEFSHHPSLQQETWQHLAPTCSKLREECSKLSYW